MGTIQNNLVVDIPQPLQFAAYIGEKEGFHLPPEYATSKVESEWVAWWRILSENFAKVITDSGEHIKIKNNNPHELTQLDNVFETIMWSPPNFTSMDAQPELQSLLRQSWPEFKQKADVFKMEMAKASESLLRKINFSDLVQECFRLKDRSQIAAFSLRIDLVRWPRDYTQQITNDHFIIGSNYLKDSLTFTTFLKETIP